MLIHLQYARFMIHFDIIVLISLLVINPARKLQWFAENQPYDVAEVRRLFYQYVSRLISDSLFTTHILQLRTYRLNAGLQTPKTKSLTSTSHLLDKTSHGMEWADEILDDVIPATIIGSRGLDAEIEAYFIDGQVRVDPIKFWQVCHSPVSPTE